MGGRSRATAKTATNEVAQHCALATGKLKTGHKRGNKHVYGNIPGSVAPRVTPPSHHTLTWGQAPAGPSGWPWPTPPCGPGSHLGPGPPGGTRPPPGWPVEGRRGMVTFTLWNSKKQNDPKHYPRTVDAAPGRGLRLTSLLQGGRMPTKDVCSCCSMCWPTAPLESTATAAAWSMAPDMVSASTCEEGPGMRGKGFNHSCFLYSHGNFIKGSMKNLPDAHLPCLGCFS